MIDVSGEADSVLDPPTQQRCRVVILSQHARELLPSVSASDDKICARKLVRNKLCQHCFGEICLRLKTFQ